MLSALINIRPEKWAALVPMIPIYIFSGGADPVGNFGAGPAEVYAWLYETGHDVTLRLYPGKRHEMLNETNRNEVEENLFRWLDDKAFRTL
jgi:alpha-beta hydrolase superfamily lysophospholipase